MDRILITGVAGFIGSNLAKELTKDPNNQIIGVDNFSSSTMSNLYPLLKCENFTFEQHDLINPLEITVDKIYHLAGNGDLSRYFENKYDFILEQIEITKNIVKLAQNNGSRLIITSQNKDYQDKNKELFKYFNSLKLIEDLILELIEKNKIDATIVNLDNAYGKGMLDTDKRIIPNSIIKLFKGENITLEQDESFYFTYIDDVIYNLVKIMNNNISKNIIDVFSKDLYLKSDILKLISSSLKSNSKIELLTPIVTHPNYKKSDCFLENGDEIKCETKVLDGIINTVNHFKLIYFS